MDVIFQPQNGSPFVVEVGFFDTVLEIKQKIEKYHRIPVAKQTLIFDRRILPDDADVAQCALLQNSIVRLTERADATIRLCVKLPGGKTHVVLLDVDLNDTTVASLKDRIAGESRELQASPVTPRNVAVRFNGAELVHEKSSLGECGVSEGSQVEASFRPAISPAAKKRNTMKVMVLTKCGSRKIPVEVSASDNVGELRKELQKLHQKLHFQLPPDGYFFIFKQNVMDDNETFRWHEVAAGDTIEIFNGSVSGGS